MATARYLLRATGRPTPFGLFAGVAPMALGPGTKVRWGGCHRAVAGLGRPAAPALSPALVEGDSIAYLTLERVATEDGTEPRFRLGAVGYGPASGVLAQRLCGQIRAWGGNRTVEPVISLYPAGTPDGQLATGYVIEKPSARMVITF